MELADGSNRGLLKRKRSPVYKEEEGDNSWSPSPSRKRSTSQHPHKKLQHKRDLWTQAEGSEDSFDELSSDYNSASNESEGYERKRGRPKGSAKALKVVKTKAKPLRKERHVDTVDTDAQDEDYVPPSYVGQVPNMTAVAVGAADNVPLCALLDIPRRSVRNVMLATRPKNDDPNSPVPSSPPFASFYALDQALTSATNREHRASKRAKYCIHSLQNHSHSQEQRVLTILLTPGAEEGEDSWKEGVGWTCLWKDCSQGLAFTDLDALSNHFLLSFGGGTN